MGSLCGLSKIGFNESLELSNAKAYRARASVCAGRAQSSTDPIEARTSLNTTESVSHGRKSAA
jgi:hypothetical protein